MRQLAARMDRASEGARDAQPAGDNAGGGDRGLRATVSPQLLESVASAYGIRVGDHVVDLGGSSNLNVRVGDVENYVVRVYRPHMLDVRLRAIRQVRHRLAAAGVPCDGVVPTLDGQRCIMFDARLVEVEHYVDHDADMDSWERLSTGFRTLGVMHDALAGLEADEAARSPRYANYISEAEALEATRRGAQRIRRWNASPTELQVADDAEQLAQFLSERRHGGELPAQLVHGDYWDNNVFFQGSELVFVTDFDYMGHRPRIDDLALTMYFACQQFYESRVSDGQLERLADLLHAYDKGTVRPLSAGERAAVPLAIARQPLWSIGGWVTWLDDEQAARQHAAAAATEVGWALALTHDLGRWQAAFAH